MKFLLIRNTPTEAPGLVGQFLRGRNVDCHDASAFDPAGLPPSDAFDALAVFGSPESCTQLSRLPTLGKVRELMAEFVRGKKPVLGICFGGQLLAHVLGAKVHRNPQPEFGSYAVDLTDAGKASPFFEGFPSSFPAAQWHGDTFDLPAGATLLATSPLCPHQAFSYGNCLGLQFHPEVTRERALEWADEYAADLKKFDKSPQQVCDELSASHEQRAKLCKQLVQNFLTITGHD